MCEVTEHLGVYKGTAAVTQRDAGFVSLAFVCTRCLQVHAICCNVAHMACGLAPVMARSWSAVFLFTNGSQNASPGLHRDRHLDSLYVCACATGLQGLDQQGRRPT